MEENICLYLKNVLNYALASANLSFDMNAILEETRKRTEPDSAMFNFVFRIMIQLLQLPNARLDRVRIR